MCVYVCTVYCIGLRVEFVLKVRDSKQKFGKRRWFCFIMTSCQMGCHNNLHSVYNIRASPSSVRLFSISLRICFVVMLSARLARILRFFRRYLVVCRFFARNFIEITMIHTDTDEYTRKESNKMGIAIIRFVCLCMCVGVCWCAKHTRIHECQSKRKRHVPHAYTCPHDPCVH